jgi:cytochrome P450
MKQGNTIRYEPRFFIDLDFIDLFPKATDGEKNTAYAKTLVSRFIGGPNIVLLGGNRWKKQRMVANPAFHRAMPIQLFGHLTQELFTVLDKQESSVVNASEFLQHWTLDAIGEAGFGT